MSTIKSKIGRKRYHAELDRCLIERIVWQGSATKALEKVRIVAGIWRYSDSSLIKIWIRQQRLRQYVKAPGVPKSGQLWKRQKLDSPRWLNKSLGRVTYEQYMCIVSGVRSLLAEYNSIPADTLHQSSTSDLP